MAFVDEARIYLKAGSGGKGCTSFYSDRYSRHPKSDGGDGGDGGGIKFVADKSLRTLLDFRFKQHYKAKNGLHGSSRNKQGRCAHDCILKVPVGTIIKDDETGLVIKDLCQDGQEVTAAKGGRGGWGNNSHKMTRDPQEGESKVIRLELKLIADVGLIGFPNAGKSTLISSLSNVKPKIASYPFTTKQPVLGIVHSEQTDFVIADLPGLIEGAHQGRGLGYQFLKHAQRSKILIQIIDMAATEGRDPLDDYEKIITELYKYDKSLLLKKKFVVANKMDLPEARHHLRRFKKKYAKEKIIAISAEENRGCQKVCQCIKEILWIRNYQKK